MNYVVVGLNHQTSPVGLRERLFIPEPQLPEALQELVSFKGISEGLILSTCNRVEIYASAASEREGVRNIKHFLSGRHQVDLGLLEPHLYNYTDYNAVRHVFRVASSLDSMVVGEAQITGQVKTAYQAAATSKTLGIFLNRFMDRALHVAKKVRSETAVSEKSVSIGSAAVDLARKIFGDLSQKKVVLVGAGEMGELVVSCLKSEGVSELRILNRSLERARHLAQQIGAVPDSLDSLEDALTWADVCIFAAEGFLMDGARAKALSSRRRMAPLFLIDLGVPRNVEPAVNHAPNVYLYNIDDLKEVVTSNQAARNGEAKKAEEIVDVEATRFYESTVSFKPTVDGLGRKFELIRKGELEKTFKKLVHLKEEDRIAFEKCTEAIVARILHDPVLLLKSDHENEGNAHQLLKKLFKLEE